MRASRPWIVLGSGVVVASTVAACQLVAGLSDLRSGDVPDAGASGADGGAGVDGASSDGGGQVDAAPATPYLGGQVSYLRAGSRVVLTTGIQDVTVSAEGAFAFPGPVGVGSTYEVSVQDQPAGQTCWVVNPKGTYPAAGMPDLDVRCTLVETAREPGSAQSSAAARTFAPLPGNATVRVTLTRPTSMLLALHVSDLETNGWAVAEIGIKVDGAAPIALANRTVPSLGPVSVGSNVVVNLGPGTHTITGVWRNGSAATVTDEVYVNHAGYGTELSAVALESLPGFVAAQGARISGGVTVGAGDVGFTSLGARFDLKLGAGQPVFLSAVIPAMWGDRMLGAVTVNGTPLALGKQSYDINGYAAMTFVPSIVDTLPAGTSTIDAKVARTETGARNDATRQEPDGSGLPDGALTAISFRPETPSGTLRLGADSVASATSSWLPVVLDGKAVEHRFTTGRAGHALVVFHASNVRPMDDTEARIDLGVFVDGALVNLSRARTHDLVGDFNTAAVALVTVAPIQGPGSHKVDLRIRNDRAAGTNALISSLNGSGDPNKLANFSFVLLD